MKRILITGAGGSIGRELTLQLARQSGTVHLILNDISEINLFEIQQELEARKFLTYELLLGDCGDNFILEKIFKSKVDSIFHAAAYKHVGMSQLMPQTYFRYNLRGFLNIVEFSKQKSSQLILISSDKAVHPINPMGMSKRLCEFIALAALSKGQNVSIVRFGNVMNSSGSVVPLFKSQIENGGPIMLSHKDATRYFMSISQAVELVLLTSQIKPNIYLLDMGLPVKIIDIAYDIASQYSKTIVEHPISESEISLEIIGLRNGEKLEETLTYGTEAQSEIQRVHVAVENCFPSEDFIEEISQSVKNDQYLDYEKIDWGFGRWKT